MNLMSFEGLKENDMVTDVIDALGVHLNISLVGEIQSACINRN